MVPGFRGDGKYARSGGLDGRSAHPLVKATRRRSASGRRMAGPSYGGFSENPVEITRGERRVYILGRALREATNARPGETNRSRSSFALSEQGAQIGPQAFGDDLVPGGGGVDTVGLVEARVGRHAVEEKGHERDLGAPRDRREHRLELRRVLRPVVRRHAHAREQYARAREIRSRGQCSMSFVMIRIRDLVMRLPSGGRPLTILDGVTLDIGAGEVCAITGPSGSGKSTLLGLVAGLDRPSSGSIAVAGVEITRLAEDALARFRRDTLGYVFQSYHLIPTLTAVENVAVPLEIARAPNAVGRARDLLDDVGLADRAHHYPVQLSGGEQQRAAPARAVAPAPPLPLADEPTGNLDSATGAQIIELLLALKHRRGSTLVLVTHDQALARHADRVVKLHDGRILNGAA